MNQLHKQSSLCKQGPSQRGGAIAVIYANKAMQTYERVADLEFCKPKITFYI